MCSVFNSFEFVSQALCLAMSTNPRMRVGGRADVLGMSVACCFGVPVALWLDAVLLCARVAVAVRFE